MDSPRPSTTPPPQKTGLHLKRPCLVVSDLERSLTLYRDILGFQLDYIGEASPNSYLYKVFQIPSEAQIRFAALSTPHEIRALALTEVKGIVLPSYPPPYRAATVVQVEDVPPSLNRFWHWDYPSWNPASLPLRPISRSPSRGFTILMTSSLSSTKPKYFPPAPLKQLCQNSIERKASHHGNIFGARLSPC